MKRVIKGRRRIASAVRRHLQSSGVTMEAAAVAALGPCSSTTQVTSHPTRLGFFSARISQRGVSTARYRNSFRPSHSGLWLKLGSPRKQGSLRQHDFGSGRANSIRASSIPADPNDSFQHAIAPLQLESPIGQFLSQILVSHPHLLPAAVEQQLEQLKTNMDEEKNEDQPTVPTTDLVLHRRIAEVKANERKRTLEEILYALVVQKFVEADVSLVPALSQSPDPSRRVDQWPPAEDKLKKMHSPEAYEMIKNHLHLILGQRLGDSNTIQQISKLRVGQVYAASVMYGYFLKRVDQRYQLERIMKSLPTESGKDDGGIKQQTMPDELGSSAQVKYSHPEVSSWSPPPGTSPGGFGFGIKSTPLRTYVMNFDPETLQRYATIRSKEAFSIVEKHTEALFGRPEIVITPQATVDTSKDELIKISFSALKRLILEAVTFGSLLWDVESYIDTRYHFVTS